jgi:hypothetical protein
VFLGGRLRTEVGACSYYDILIRMVTLSGKGGKDGRHVLGGVLDQQVKRRDGLGMELEGSAFFRNGHPLGSHKKQVVSIPNGYK